MTTLMTEPDTTNRQTPAETAPQRIVLTGFMGAGKSTVGRLLAAQIGWDFVDVDQAVEARTGMSIAAIFATGGEIAFRRQESSAIARALGRDRVVIALGGGAPEILANRLLLEQTTATAVVFLDAPFEVLFDRCVLQEGAAVRPVLMDAESALARFAQRTPLYRRCARHHVTTAEQVPHETVLEVLRLIRVQPVK